MKSMEESLQRDYIFDPTSKCWSRAGSKDFDYSDGNDVENHILSIIQQASDLSSTSMELKDHCVDWPSHYHLSPLRANLLRPLTDFLQGRILEVGAGLGAITRYLGELGGEVLALEGSKRRATAARARCRDLENVFVLSESFQQFNAIKDFDVVVLVGVLEYARMFFDSNNSDPVDMMLSYARSLMKPDGILIVAIENQLGLKYFAGSPEDHIGIPMYGVEDLYSNKSVVTFGQRELHERLVSAGFVEQNWWFPFPDYKLPVSVFSSQIGDPKVDLSPLLANSVLADLQNPGDPIFSLEQAWGVVYRNGLVPNLSNSFLVMASGSRIPITQKHNNVLGYYFSLNRRPEFAKELRFELADNGKVIIRKKKLFPSHTPIENLPLTMELEQQEDFIDGVNWQNQLRHILNRPGWSVKDLEVWASVWYKAFLAYSGLNIETDQLFSKHPIRGDFFDAIPKNLIVTENQQMHFFDQEWKLSFNIELGYLFFRAIFLELLNTTRVAAPVKETPLNIYLLFKTVSDSLGLAISVLDLARYAKSERDVFFWAAGMKSWLSAEELAGRSLSVRNSIANNATTISHMHKTIETLSVQVNETKEKTVSLSKQLNEREKALQQANATLQEIYGSRAWRLVQRIWSVRRTIAPPGSKREQALRQAFQILLYPLRRIKGASQVVQDLTPPTFDKDWYLANYPDVAMANVDPYQHYMQKGRFEGRLGQAPVLVFQEGLAGFDPSKETVLVVSHEASRTGAPVLSFNIIQNLRKKYNVVSLLLGAGPIVKNFSDLSSGVIGPMPLRGIPLLADAVIDQITKLYKFKFAIVNSIESGVVLPALARRFVPAINLVHEFATYTHPKSAFPEAALWAQEMIFSARVTLENALHEHPLLAEHSFHIIPQGRCDIPSVDNDIPSLLREEAKVLGKLRPEGSSADMFVILGAGTVQIRKGVDLFIDCAAKILRSAPETHFRFVWIGNGYDPTQDLAYSVYLADQIQRAGLQEHVLFMENTSNIEAAYRAADMLILSSRLDPLPNVAIDAMIHGMPLICFEDTTGIADILTANGFADHCVASYLDTGDMAAKISAFIQSKSLRQDIGERLKQLAFKQFDMAYYTTQLEELGLESNLRITQEQLDTREIANAGIARMDYFQDQILRDTLKSPDEAYRYYIRSWASRIRRRKLFPGFHPGIFSEQSGECTDGRDPLAEYIRSGQPDGPWRYDVLTPEDTTRTIPSGLHIALHIHVYYPDLLPDILARLNQNRVRPDLFISLPTDRMDAEADRVLKSYSGKVIDIQAVPNRGRDIAPFLTTFGPAFINRYDLVGHLHTKKTASVQDSQMGEVWRLFLLENLLGGKSNMADTILRCMAADPTIGMIFPDDPNVMGWTKNRSYAKELGSQIGINALPEYFLFPIGTMFWARVNALAPLFELGLEWQDYPEEPLPYDGSMLHAIERLLPFVALKQGYRMMLTNVPGITR